MMYVCTDGHPTICYEGPPYTRGCPVCPLEGRVKELETRLENVRIERDAAEAALEELEDANELGQEEYNN